MKYPKKFNDLIEGFETFPGIGPKTAERLAFYTIAKQNKNSSLSFVKALDEALSSICECKICGNIADDEKCEICKDDTREGKLMIVESAKDVISFEKTGVFKGRYHVLNGLISPTNGKGPDDIDIEKLVKRCENENFSEIIIATSSTIDGEITAMYIKKMLEKLNIKTYRIGYGLPASTDIEYVDEITLIKSLESKKEM